MEKWVHVYGITARQHGVITRSQALQVGISSSTFTRPRGYLRGRARVRVRREQWTERHRGVFVVPGVRPGFMTDLSAAVRAAGSAAMVTDLVQQRLVAEGFRPDSHPVAIEVEVGRRLHPDITFARQRVCIECDSLAHHGSQRAIDLDHRKDQSYSGARWKCVRIGWRRFERDWTGFVAILRHELEEWPRVAASLDAYAEASVGAIRPTSGVDTSTNG